MNGGRVRDFLTKPGMTVLLLCLALGIGFFLGAMLFRFRSGETIVVTGSAPAAATAAPAELLDLNTADAAALEHLPGIGPELARRIVEYRTENGPFSHCYELTNVSGIGSRTYEGLKDLITVEP